MNRRDFLKGLAVAGASIAGKAEESAQAAPVVPPGMHGEHLVYEWKGSPFDIGFQHGRTLREPIIKEAHPAVETLAKTRKTSVEKALDYFTAAHEPLFRQHAPSALEEIEGIGRGSGLGYNYAFFAATRDGTRIAPAEAGNCTAVTCSKQATAAGKVFIGQNKDTNSALDRYRIMRLSHASGRKMIVLNYPGWIANIGMTSDGVAFTGNSLYGKPFPGDIIPHSLLKRMILEKSSVQEVLDSMPKGSYPDGCVMMADATGHMVCIEFVHGDMNIRDVSGGAFGHANTVLCERLRPYEAAALVSPSSPVRQRNIQRHLDGLRGRLTADEIKKGFANHADFPLCVCRHRLTPGSESTTASFVANLTDREIEIAIGNPCTAPYRRYALNS